MQFAYSTLWNANRRSHVRFALIATGLMLLSISAAPAQTTYSCFPNCDEHDGRFLVLAGAGTNTLAGDTVVLKITSPSIADSVEIGIFDGDSGGHWDRGGVNLVYTLYADPAGEGHSRNNQIAQWSGADMGDTVWTTFKVANAAAARAPNGNYIYVLKIHNPDPSVAQSWSAFKVRTDGAVALKGYQAFAVVVPMASTQELNVIYPAGLDSLDISTYDGDWTFHLDVPVAATSLAVWDGDMDYGNYTCDSLDTDDPDTPNDSVPSWAANTPARPEGTAYGSGCLNADGTPASGTGTGSPPDDNFRSVWARAPGVWYEIVHPDGTHYANHNPSGNLEWEQFRLSTAPYDSTAMDYHVDSLPAGIYDVHMHGMDLQNLNAWRFFNDALGESASAEVLGVDADGNPVKPLQPYDVSGVLFYDNDSDGVQDADEPGIPAVTVYLYTDVNGDNIIDFRDTTETDESGAYTFTNVYPGTQTVSVDAATLSSDVVAVSDGDGTTSPNTVTVTASGGEAVTGTSFGYQRTTNAAGVGTRGYWTHHGDDWPVDGLVLGGNYYSKCQLMQILKRPTRGDCTYIMAAQLIAAMLNKAAGNPSYCVDDAIDAGNEWLETNEIGSRVRSRSSAWSGGGGGHCGSGYDGGSSSSTQTGEDIKDTLDSYNNGHMCADHIE